MYNFRNQNAQLRQENLKNCLDGFKPDYSC